MTLYSVWFADDTVLCSVAHSHAVCIDQFQHALSNLDNGGKTGDCLSTSPNKSYGHLQKTDGCTRLFDKPINVASYQQHLGVNLSADLKWNLLSAGEVKFWWNHHVDNIPARARPMLGVFFFFF